MALSPEQLAEFVENGAVTVRTPLDEGELRRCGEAMAASAPQTDGATRTSRTCNYYDADILHIIAHPWLEAVAKQALSASAVTLFQTALLNAWPDPDADPDVTDLQQMDGYHTDMQYTGEDLFAAPRRMQVSFFLWVSDVPLGRANMHFRPGTHRLMAEAWARRPELGGLLPRITGTNWRGETFPPEVLEVLPPAQPVVASAGDVTVLTTGAVHSASPNFDADGTRQCLVVTFTATDVEVGLPKAQAEVKRKWDAELRRRLPAERQDIVAGPPDGEGPYGWRYWRKWIDQAPRL